MNDFVHLHVHSEWSVLDGCAMLGNLVETAKEKGFDAIALTDHGSVSGTYQFYNLCKKHEIKPIIGVEMYFVPDANIKPYTKEEIEKMLIPHDKSMHQAIKEKIKAENEKRRERFHITLLAKSHTGYMNLLGIVSESYLSGGIQGGYGRMIGRCDWSMLEKYSKDLIAMSACCGGILAKHIVNDNEGDALKNARKLKSLFGEDFYIEIMPLSMEEQKKANASLVDIAQDTNIKLVATNDCHYITKEDAEYQNVLLACQQKTSLDNMNWSFDTDELYLRTRKEMEDAFDAQHGYIPMRIVDEALNNTLEVADKVDIQLPKSTQRLPRVDISAYNDYDEFNKWRGTGGLLGLKEDLAAITE